MAKYTVFESTNMKSTRYAEPTRDAICDTDVENGTFGYLTDLEDGDTVVQKFVKGFKECETIVVVDQPVWDADTTYKENQRRDKFICEANTPFRVRVVGRNDKFAISKEGVTGESASLLKPNAYVTIDATTGKLVAKDSVTEGAKFEGKVRRKEIRSVTLNTAVRNYGYPLDMYVIEVVKLSYEPTNTGAGA